MSRRMVCFDLEATGPDPYGDSIVEMCFVDGRSGEILLDELVNPRRFIPNEASLVHGIYDEDVAERPPFEAWAESVQQIIQGAVLVGYNLRRYDSILIHRELRASHQAGLEVDEHGRIVQPEIDLFGMWQRCEPRKLSIAVKRFAGVELEDGHTANADTLALAGVLTGMREAFGLKEATLEQLQELSKPEGAIDRDGKFRRREDGVVVFTIGATTRDQPVLENPGMLRWMLDPQRDFSPDTLFYAQSFLREAMRDG